MLEMMFDEEIETWKVLDLAQNRNSIVIFMNFHHLILARIHQSKAWSAQNQSQRTRIWKEIAMLFEKKLNYEWEKKFEWERILDLEMWKMINLLQFC